MGESTPRIVLIGAGRVASHLAEALRDCGMPPLEVGGRVRCAAMPPDADIYVIAVTDAAIAQVAEEIGNVPGLVLHTAGSVPVDEFVTVVVAFDGMALDAYVNHENLANTHRKQIIVNTACCSCCLFQTDGRLIVLRAAA